MAVETPPQPSVYNLANQLTASRLLLGVGLFVFIEMDLWIACLVIFIVAAITDWLDGYVARRQNLVSSLGRMFDPLVDKVVVSGAFILLLDDLPGLLAPWMVVLVVAREFIVTGIRGFMEQQGVPFGADKLGKIKMVLQCAVLIAAFVLLQAVRWELITLEPTSTEQMASVVSLILFGALVYTMVLITALSGLQYLSRAAKGLR